MKIKQKTTKQIEKSCDRDVRCEVMVVLEV